MRRPVLVALVGVGLAGCFGAPLPDSTTSCEMQTPQGDGILWVVNGSGPLVGRCVALHKEPDLEKVLLLSKLKSDGTAFLPTEEAGRYYMSVYARDPDDQYCADHATGFADHPGQGILQVRTNMTRVCA